MFVYIIATGVQAGRILTRRVSRHTSVSSAHPRISNIFDHADTVPNQMSHNRVEPMSPTLNGIASPKRPSSPQKALRSRNGMKSSPENTKRQVSSSITCESESSSPIAFNRPFSHEQQEQLKKTFKIKRNMSIDVSKFYDSIIPSAESCLIAAFGKFGVIPGLFNIHLQCIDSPLC